MQKNRIIGILSGLTFSGKSFFMKSLLENNLFQGATTIQMDEIRIRYWQDRSLTEAEKIYRNELVRQEIKIQMIPGNAERILAEIPMLTHLFHQEPMVKNTEEIRWYLNAMANERKESQGVKLDLRVILLFCSLESVEKRVAYRIAEQATKSDVFSSAQYCSIARQFELPTAYTPLYIDTSVESNNQDNLNEIVTFLETGKYDLLKNSEMGARAAAYIKEAAVKM